MSCEMIKKYPQLSSVTKLKSMDAVLCLFEEYFDKKKKSCLF